MMSRFTERAQEALQRAQQIMFARQHTQLDVEHLFLALLQQRNSLPAVIIARLGGDVEAIVKRLEAALGNMQSFTVGKGVTTGYITLRANRVLQGAVEEADRLNDEFISTEHLFLALVVESGGATGRILRDTDIDQEKVATALRELRGNPGAYRRETPTPQDHPSRTSTHTIVNPETLVRPTGFSHGIFTEGRQMLFLAGQTATDQEGNIVAPGDVVGQYRQVLTNLKAVVEEAGGEMTGIAKMTIFVKDRDDYKAHLKELGQVHKDFFGTYYPATSLFEISRFFEDEVLVEIEGIAVVGSRW
ncbi:MAG: Rid family hydrolase [Chloroflexota bacterium]|nr:Rid family hydrolase [Chloroflexota bacterium]MDQ5865931.1 Rid family hydrolase [Chloroflexota bacterium]